MTGQDMTQALELGRSHTEQRVRHLLELAIGMTPRLRAMTFVTVEDFIEGVACYDKRQGRFLDSLLAEATK